MTIKVTARFDGKALIPETPLPLEAGRSYELQVEETQSPAVSAATGEDRYADFFQLLEDHSFSKDFDPPLSTNLDDHLFPDGAEKRKPL